MFPLLNNQIWQGKLRCQEKTQNSRIPLCQEFFTNMTNKPNNSLHASHRLQNSIDSPRVQHERPIPMIRKKDTRIQTNKIMDFYIEFKLTLHRLVIHILDTVKRQPQRTIEAKNFPHQY